ncbi:MAG: hypothetical protein ACHQIL_03380 [Steroidobacterales bacterium]
MREQDGLIVGARLMRELWSSRVLSQQEKCAVFLDNTMYPSYELGPLAVNHCQR